MKYINNSELNIDFQIDNNGIKTDINMSLLIQSEIDQFIPTPDFILTMKELRILNTIYDKINKIEYNEKSILLEDSEHELILRLNNYMGPRFVARPLRDCALILDDRLNSATSEESTNT